MQSSEFVVTSPESRVLVVSQRNRAPEISRCTLFEFEDMVVEFDDADLAAVPPRRLPSRWQRGVGKIRARLGRHPLLRHRAPPSARRYELLLVVCEDLSDLMASGQVGAWCDLADRRVCYIEEMWARDVPGRWFETDLLRGFDHVFLSCAGAVDALHRATGVPVSFLPPSVDALGFCPGAEPPPRVIDIYSMGRRSAATHAALQRYANARGLFYVYDTFAANRVIVPSEHRRLLGNWIKRSRYFVANRAKIDHAETAEQEEIGSRHFEGAAGGAVMIGEPPRCETFRQCFDWPDAVVPMPWNTTEVADLFAALESDPERLARIRADNVRNVLLRHDWAYRWQAVLDAVGIEPRPQLAARRAAMAKLAAAMTPAQMLV